MLKEIINYILYSLSVFKLKPEEEENIIFVSQNTAIKSLKNQNYSFYKIYPIEKNLLPIKIRIDKIKREKSNFYFYSAWIWDKTIENREYLKYSEKDFDFILEEAKSKIKNQTNYYYDFLNILNYEELENLLMKTKNEIIQEYVIDHVYKIHYEKLLDLMDLIFSNNFNKKIQQYYKKTVRNVFNFMNYDDLTVFYQTLENSFNQNYEIKELKNELLKIIQEKNLFEMYLK